MDMPARAQGSSTYESIYEPINPRPPSQLSSRSNYSLYTPYVNGSGSTGGGGVTQLNKMPTQKEAEVDVLTNLLVRSMDNNQDLDSYGWCLSRPSYPPPPIPVTRIYADFLLYRLCVSLPFLCRVSLSALPISVTHI